MKKIIIQAIKTPTVLQLINRFILYVRIRKYEFLLLSFMVLIFGNTFDHRLIIFVSNILQNMLTGVFVFYRRKRLRNLTLCLMLVTIIFGLFGAHLRFIDVKSWQGIIYLIFFFLVAREVFSEVLYSKTVTRELLAAALCGFVLLCLIGTFLFFQIDLKLPYSFSNTGTEKEILYNLNYFSFTTLLTIGYGDITPPIAGG